MNKNKQSLWHASKKANRGISAVLNGVWVPLSSVEQGKTCFPWLLNPLLTSISSQKGFRLDILFPLPKIHSFTKIHKLQFWLRLLKTLIILISKSNQSNNTINLMLRYLEYYTHSCYAMIFKTLHTFLLFMIISKRWKRR